jgi:hypothetical protein
MDPAVESTRRRNQTMRVFLAAFACLLFLNASAHTQTTKIANGQAAAHVRYSAPTTCPNDPVLPSDGTTTSDDLIFPASSAFYTVNAKGGHSYSVEVWDPYDPTAAMSPVITVTSDCSSSIPNVVDVTHLDPDLSGGFSDRVSWIQGSDQTLYVSVSNPDQNTAYTYNIRVTDTTLRSPRWSTVVGFSTHYGFMNNTASPLSGVLTVVSIQPSHTYTLPVTFGANSELFIAIPSDSFNVPPDLYGFATLAFVGPAGAISADGYFQTVTNGVFTIAPTIFGPVNRQH